MVTIMSSSFILIISRTITWPSLFPGRQRRAEICWDDFAAAPVGSTQVSARIQVAQGYLCDHQCQGHHCASCLCLNPKESQRSETLKDGVHPLSNKTGWSVDHLPVPESRLSEKRSWKDTLEDLKDYPVLVDPDNPLPRFNLTSPKTMVL